MIWYLYWIILTSTDIEKAVLSQTVATNQRSCFQTDAQLIQIIILKILFTRFIIACVLRTWCTCNLKPSICCMLTIESNMIWKPLFAEIARNIGPSLAASCNDVGVVCLKVIQLQIYWESLTEGLMRISDSKRCVHLS